MREVFAGEMTFSLYKEAQVLLTEALCTVLIHAEVSSWSQLREVSLKL